MLLSQPAVKDVPFRGSLEKHTRVGQLLIGIKISRDGTWAALFSENFRPRLVGRSID